MRVTYVEPKKPEPELPKMFIVVGKSKYGGTTVAYSVGSKKQAESEAKNDQWIWWIIET